jgi:hypothetical protein
MKPPMLFQSHKFQMELIEQGSREQILHWLTWNDPNGVYVDEHSSAEGKSPLTLEQARDIMRDQIDRDITPD